MESGDCFQHLKNSILSVFPVDHSSLTELLDIFIPVTLPSGAFFSKAGDYSSSFGFICRGAMKSYYTGHSNQEITKNLFADHNFVIPLPSFIYRKPSYLNFQAITEVEILQAKFSKLEELTLKYPSVNKFTRTLIDREWIVNRELQESGFHIYNFHTRFKLFLERYNKHIHLFNPETIASLLQIPLKQIEKLLKENSAVEQR